MSSSKQRQIGDYFLNEQIGSGGFAKVVLGIHIPTGEKVAIKIMDKKEILSDENNKIRVENEIKILKKVRHNNIIKLYEVMETPQKIYLVMEYCDKGELFDYIVSKDHLNEDQSRIFFHQIIDALTYLHSQNIAHRDIKPENILLQSGTQMICKLIDFGISRTYNLNQKIKTPCGTASYAPPEMHKGLDYNGLLSDIWSAGVLLYAMIFGYLPFCEEDEDTNVNNIILGNYEIPEEASDELSDLLIHLLDINPLTRYDLDKIKSHPWYKKKSYIQDLPGLIVGFHKIPIDKRILELCEEYGFKKEEVEQSVLKNKYDNKSAIYYIILNKMKREGCDSVADLFSQDYLEYIKNPDNLIPKEEKEKENNNEEEIGLTIFDNFIKQKDEKNEENKNKFKTDKKLIYIHLSQVSSEKRIKHNKSEKEISAGNENEKSKKENKEKDSYSSSPQRSDKSKSSNSSNSSPKRQENATSSEESITEENDNDNNIFSVYDEFKKMAIEDSSEDIKEIKEKEKEIREENKTLNEIPNKKIQEESNVKKEEEKDLNKNKENNTEIENIKEKEIKNNISEVKIEHPAINNEKKEENMSNNPAQNNNNEINKEEENIIANAEEINKGDGEKINEENQKKEQEIAVSNEIQTHLDKEKEKEKENLTSIQISHIESERNNKTLTTLKEKISPEKGNKNKIKNKEENNEVNKNENKEEKTEIIKKEKSQEKNKEEENELNKIENKSIQKTLKNSFQPEKKESSGNKYLILSNSLFSKDSFVTEFNSGKLMSNSFENIEDEVNNNSLNISSYTSKLTDTIKESILKLRNPKKMKTHQEKEVYKVLQEIKQKKGTISIKSKKSNQTTLKKKNIKMTYEPLFKNNKTKEHTIIRNRNASAINCEKKGKIGKEVDQINKRKKETSMAKNLSLNLNNANNISLKNNINKIKIEIDKDKNKDKNKEKDKESINEISIKKRNIRLTKKYKKNEKNKKHPVKLKKRNILKPVSFTIKNSLNISSSYVHNTYSNTNRIKKTISTQVNCNLKSPRIQLKKTIFESPYHKLKNIHSNTNRNINKNDMKNKYLSQSIKLSISKNNTLKAKNDKNEKNNNKKFKKNIRLSFKKIQEVIEENGLINGINSNKNNQKKKINITFGSNMRNSAFTTYKKEANNKKKNEIHSKIKTLRETYNPKKHMYTDSNELAFSYENINKYKRKIKLRKERNNITNNIKINRYDSVVKTERNNGKGKPFLEMTLYEGNKNKINSGKIVSPNFYNNNKVKQKQKNIYYGPIDIRNIVIGDSTNEINEKITDILNKNKVKNWKINPNKFYCNKNGVIFILKIFLTPNKIIINDNKIKENKEEPLFNRKINNDNNDIQKNKEDNNNAKNNKLNKTKKIFYITVLSKDNNNQEQTKSINKIINKSIWKDLKIK